jgi:hypothetical protein
VNSCPVCGASCSALPHCCGSVGPRIGQQAPRCVRPPGHDGDHQAHESWNSAVDADAKPLTWADLKPNPTRTVADIEAAGYSVVPDFPGDATDTGIDPEIEAALDLLDRRFGPGRVTDGRSLVEAIEAALEVQRSLTEKLIQRGGDLRDLEADELALARRILEES